MNEEASEKENVRGGHVWGRLCPRRCGGDVVWECFAREKGRVVESSVEKKKSETTKTTTNTSCVMPGRSRRKRMERCEVASETTTTTRP